MSLRSLDAAPAPPVPHDSEYLIKNWSVDDGLSSSSIYSIKQSSDGYLWLRTKTGMVRFDGVRFVEVFREITEPQFAFGESKGEIWIYDKNHQLYHLNHGRLEPVEFSPERSKDVFGVYVDREGVSWVSQADRTRPWRDGRWLTNEELAAAGRKPLPDGFHLKNQLPDGRWFGHYRGKFALCSRDEITQLEDNQSPKAGGEYYATGMRKLAWLLERPPGGGYSIRSISQDGKFGDAALLPWIGNIFGSGVEEDSQGNVWICSATHGLARYGTDGTFELFNPGAIGNRRGITTDATRCLLHDLEDNIWLGTDGGGIFRLSRRTFHTYGIADGLTTDNVYAVAPCKTGGVWIGTHSAAGEALFKWQDGRITFQPGMGFYGWSVHEDQQGTIWVGDYENGLHTLRNGKPISINGAPGRVFAICDDGDGGIWAGGRGLVRIIGDKVETMRWMPHAKEISALASMAAPRSPSLSPSDGKKKRDAVTSDIGRKTDPDLWIGTLTNGLYRWRIDSLDRFSTSDGLPSDEILSLHIDSQKSLWVGTRKGIARLHHGKFVSLTTAQGLLHEAISGIAEDARGNFWLHSPTGISRTERKQLDGYFDGTARSVACIGYGREDGLVTSASTSGTQARICTDRDGRMWFTTLKGVAAVNPDTMPLNTNPPPIVIEEVLMKGKSHCVPMLSSLETRRGQASGPESPFVAAYTFPAGVKGLQIRYTANGFTAPDRIRFRYRLGPEGEWVETGIRREVTFEQLSHGNYRFEVTACNEHGTWNPSGAVMTFAVLPFFWERTSFRVLSGIAVLLLVSLAVRQISTRQLRQRLLEAERETAVERERVRISRDMHDELGARLTKISVLGELANRSLAHPIEAQSHLRKLSGLATETSGSLSDLIWTVKPENDSVRSLVTHLCQLAEEFLRETEIRCRFEIPDELPESRVLPEMRRQIVLAFKEVLNNVLKHSSATEVRLKVETNPGEVVFIIADNGKGFSKDITPRPGGGNGLINLRQRLEQSGGSCEFSSPPGGGAMITLRLHLNPPESKPHRAPTQFG